MAAAAAQGNGEVRPAMVPKGTLAAVQSSVPRPPGPAYRPVAVLRPVPGPAARFVPWSRRPQFR